MAALVVSPPPDTCWGKVLLSLFIIIDPIFYSIFTHYHGILDQRFWCPDS